MRAAILGALLLWLDPFLGPVGADPLAVVVDGRYGVPLPELGLRLEAQLSLVIVRLRIQQSGLPG